MGLVLVTPATEEPVTREELKEHLKEDTADQDAHLSELIAAARGVAETYLRRALCAQQWRWTLDAFPCTRTPRDVPMPPLLSIDSVRYLDFAGAEQLLDPAVYDVDVDSQPGRIARAYSQVWPSTYEALGAVRILFTAGWADAKDIPDPIKTGMKTLIGTWYLNRESVKVGTIVARVPDTVRAMWAPWKMPYFR